MRFSFDTDAYQRNTEQARRLWDEVEAMLNRVGDPVVAKPWIASSIAELEPDYRPLAEAFAAEWLKASGESNGVPPEVFEEEVKRTFKDNIRSIFQLFRFGNFVRSESSESPS